ncbi:MAG: family 16 glycosylhydrolase [Anaerolineales bacterium]|nr:family 16 glycosylhydrolase [Anaerolineales bacterium]
MRDPPRWEILEIGGGRVRSLNTDHLRLTRPHGSKGYSDAQIDDYRRLPRHGFPWIPPVQMRLEARASTPCPQGTLGFGFWNDPFSLSLGQGGAARRLPSSPQAVWFFYGSPPHDLALAPGVPGSGWKAAVLRTPRIPSLALAPLALGAIAMAQIPGLKRPVICTALQFAEAEESLIASPLDEWHRYEIEWLEKGAHFSVDGETVLQTTVSPPAPLGFVAWIDNQYAIASPAGGFRFGVLPLAEEQWLEIRSLEAIDL